MKPGIKVSPEPSMADSEVDITLYDLPANEMVTVRATTYSGKHEFESFGVFNIDEQGQLDLSKQEPIVGSYCGVDKMGLLWSMDPSPLNKNSYARFMVHDVTKPNFITIQVYNKQFSNMHDIIGNKGKDVVCKCQITRLYMKPGTRRIVVNEPEVKGTLFLPPGLGPFPGVMYILGAMANPYETHSSLMASHGFASFNLVYFGFEEWEFHVDMKKFERAVQFLRNHPEVNGDDGISVVGVCKGGQFSLCMAECLHGIKSVAALNASIMPVHNSHHFNDKVWPGIDYENFYSQVLNKHGAMVARNGFPIITDFDKSLVSQSLFKFYDRYDIPFFIVASLGDCNVPSEHYCNQAENLLKNANHPQYFIMRCPGAGHILDPPYTPFCARTQGKPLANLVEWGGNKVPHCRAQVYIWNNVVQFLKHSSISQASKL